MGGATAAGAAPPDSLKEFQNAIPSTPRGGGSMPIPWLD